MLFYQVSVRPHQSDTPLVGVIKGLGLQIKEASILKKTKVWKTIHWIKFRKLLTPFFHVKSKNDFVINLKKMKTELLSCAHCGCDYQITIPISGISQLEYSHKNGCKRTTQVYVNDGKIITTTKWIIFIGKIFKLSESTIIFP